MKRVINNKSKKQNYFCTSTAREVEISALFTVGLSELPKQHCLGETGQDQHLKESPQHHILFYKVFHDKKHCKLPRQTS